MKWMALLLGLAFCAPGAIAAEIPKFTVKLTKATVAPMGSDVLGEGSKTVTLQIAVTNNGKRDVSLIDARIVFADRLNAHIVTVKWKDNRGIAAGKTVKMVADYWTLETEGVERLVDLPPEEMVVTFDVRKLAYKGGEVVTVK